MSRDLEDHWTTLARVKDVKRAVEIAKQAAPTEIRRQTGYAVSEFLDGILPALLQICVVQASATALGAAAGGIIGSALGGAGAVPGAIEGGALGFSLSATLIGWLGLGFLFLAVGQSLVSIGSLLQHAVSRAWRAVDHPDQRRLDVQQAGQDLARAMGMLMLLILQAIAAWLLKSGLDKLPELIAELRRSKLGRGFAEWVEKNAAKLYEDPKLRPRQAEGSTTKAESGSGAQSPSQLAGRRAADAEAPATPTPQKAQPASFLKPRLPKTALEPGATPGPVSPTINAMPKVPDNFPTISQADVNTFVSTPTAEVLPEGTKLYRIVGDTSNPSGAFWTREMPATEAEWRSAAAVKGEWNGDGGYVEYTIPKGGLPAWTGKAAPQPAALPGYVLKGGGDQVVIPVGSATPSSPMPTPWNLQ